MSKPQIIMQSELIQFTHRDVKINIALDYNRKTVSLTKPVSIFSNNDDAKAWVFSKRTRQYLGGWYIVLEALQEATKYADTRLKEQEDVRDKLAEEKVFNIVMALSEVAEDQDENSN